MRNYLIGLALATTVMLPYCAEAGYSGARASVSRISSFSARPSIRSAASKVTSNSSRISSSTASVGTTGSSRPAAAPSSIYTRPPPKASAPRPNSPQPSPQLAQVIHQHNGGSNWMGTALVMSMLHSNNLSASDRSWLEERLAEERAHEAAWPTAQVGATQAAPAPAPKDLGQAMMDGFAEGSLPKRMQFQFDLPLRVVAGETYDLKVNAQDGRGKPKDLRCILPGATVTSDGLTQQLRWTPVQPGSQVITCKSQDDADQRLLEIQSAS